MIGTLEHRLCHLCESLDDGDVNFVEAGVSFMRGVRSQDQCL